MLTPPPPRTERGPTDLARARAGDERAFSDLVEPHLRELHVHCYRMLGSVVDADDALQETLTAAWRGLDGFEERSSLRTWLYRIATNRCLNARRAAGRRRPAEPVPPFTPPEPSRRGDVTWLQPCPDALLAQVVDSTAGPAAQYVAREHIELAFIAALQRLSPRQTAVLVLCDVLGFTIAEVTEMLDSGPTAVKGTLQRARAGVAGLAPSTALADKLPPDRTDERTVARSFAAALEVGDVDAVVALLTDDAWLAMPPAPHEYVGREAVRGFLAVRAAWSADRRWKLVETAANGQPAFAVYLSEPGGSIGSAVGVMVVAVRGEGIAAITNFLDGALAVRFGLSETVTL